MSLDVPEPVAAYFAAKPCFAEDAVVHDEGGIYRGRAAIQQWLEETTRKYNFTSQPLAVERAGEKWVVSSRVSGDFPGSPVELQYAFGLTGDQIAELEIS